MVFKKLEIYMCLQAIMPYMAWPWVWHLWSYISCEMCQLKQKRQKYLPPPQTFLISSYPTHDSLCPSSLVNQYMFHFRIGDWRRGTSRLLPQLFSDFFNRYMFWKIYGTGPGNVEMSLEILARPKVMYQSNRSFNIPTPGHTLGIWRLFLPGRREFD